MFWYYNIMIYLTKHYNVLVLRNEPYCIVESEFVSEGPDELSIQPGDRVVLIERVNEDWLRGKLNEQVGIFPAAFVDIKVNIQSTPSVDDSTPSYLDDSKNVPGKS